MHVSPMPDFSDLRVRARSFTTIDRRLAGQVPALAITPVADGRKGAYESNQEGTWQLAEKVYRLLEKHLRLADGTMPPVVVAPEIVYGARTGALAQQYYTQQGVGANIWVSRSWAYSDELMSACMGIGSSEWQQAAYGLNQTDRPGAVWLKAFCAAMDEKHRPIFSIYNPDLEDEAGELAPFVAQRLVRFGRAAFAALEMRGKNYLSVGGVSMGIIGSDVRRNLLHQYFGMGTVSVDMIAVRGRMDKGFYDHEECARGCAWVRKHFALEFGGGTRPYPNERLVEECVKMTLIVRDLMIGNALLGDHAVGKKQGFTADIEQAQGYHAIAAGTQGQRAWTDLYPNFDLTESLLCSGFDWNGARQPFIVATENDSKNAVGMLAAHLISGLPQMFADIRTNWTAQSVKNVTGYDIGSIAPNGFIDKRNSGAAALEYGTDPYQLAGLDRSVHPAELSAAFWDSPDKKAALSAAATQATTYMGAILEYFPGDGLSSHYRTPGGLPMTAYRYNVAGDQPTVSVVEGETVELPERVAEVISQKTDKSWPECYWAPRGMSSFDYMSRIGPNHDANTFGLIGADLITLNAMLRIPVDFHNVNLSDLFRPTLWDRYGADDFRVCEKLGPLYA